MTKIKIISASSPEGLNKKVQDMIAEGWEPIDDLGQIQVKWDDGRSLAVIPNIDIFKILN